MYIQYQHLKLILCERLFPASTEQLPVAVPTPDAGVCIVTVEQNLDDIHEPTDEIVTVIPIPAESSNK